MRFRSLTTLLGLLLFAGTTAAQEWKDLQVLPRNISKADMKTIMKAQSKALGVDCDFCHQMPTPEKETAKKKTARTMMRMVNDINAKYLLAVIAAKPSRMKSPSRIPALSLELTSPALHICLLPGASVPQYVLIGKCLGGFIAVGGWLTQSTEEVMDADIPSCSDGWICCTNSGWRGMPRRVFTRGWSLHRSRDDDGADDGTAAATGCRYHQPLWR